MDTQQTDADVEALPDPGLRARLARTDWERDPEFVPDEQVFRLFRRAREVGDKGRMGLLSRTLSQRLLKLAKGFAVRSGIVPGILGDLDQAAAELSQYVWECLVTRPGDAAHAEKLFGQLFKRRALDFQRRLLSKKRKLQDSLDAMDNAPGDDDPEKTVREVVGLRQDATPFDTLERRQTYAEVAARLQTILTKKEHATFVMLFVDEMQVKEVAAALGVSTRMVNSYKNAALGKTRKEFKQ